MTNPIATAFAVVGILGTAGAAFATNMEALDVQANQDVSGGGEVLLPTAEPTAPAQPQAPAVVPPAEPVAPATGGGTGSNAGSAPVVSDPEPAAPAVEPAAPAPVPHSNTGGSTVSSHDDDDDEHEDHEDHEDHDEDDDD